MNGEILNAMARLGGQYAQMGPLPGYTLEFELSEDSLDPCPNACGGLTEDPYGGPCKACWAAVPGPGDEEAW